MTERLAGFKGEYLWELDIAEHHLLALADAIPAERYGWRPVADVRSVSEVFVHVAASNFALLEMIGVEAPADLYAPIAIHGMERFVARIATNRQLAARLTGKIEVARMLNASLSAWRHAFTQAPAGELERAGAFFGETTAVQRVYLRLLTHTHEHMGQLIAYVRTMGLKAPWPDPLDLVKS
jgi:uncharacterized damage-inducible protein DinB